MAYSSSRKRDTADQNAIPVAFQRNEEEEEGEDSFMKKQYSPSNPTSRPHSRDQEQGKQKRKQKQGGGEIDDQNLAFVEAQYDNSNPSSNKGTSHKKEAPIRVHSSPKSQKGTPSKESKQESVAAKEKEQTPEPKETTQESRKAEAKKKALEEYMNKINAKKNEEQLKQKAILAEIEQRRRANIILNKAKKKRNEIFASKKNGLRKRFVAGELGWASAGGNRIFYGHTTYIHEHIVVAIDATYQIPPHSSTNHMLCLFCCVAVLTEWSLLSDEQKISTRALRSRRNIKCEKCGTLGYFIEICPNNCFNEDGSDDELSVMEQVMYRPSNTAREDEAQYQAQAKTGEGFLWGTNTTYTHDAMKPEREKIHRGNAKANLNPLRSNMRREQAALRRLDEGLPTYAFHSKGEDGYHRDVAEVTLHKVSCQEQTKH